MRNIYNYSLAFTFFFSIIAINYSCNNDSDCDKNAKLILNFKLEVQNGENRLVNTTTPTCLVDKVEWDLDGSKAFTENPSPVFKKGNGKHEVTMRINGLSYISKTITIGDVSATQYSVDFIAPLKVKVGESVAFTDVSEPAAMISSRYWNFGDNNSNMEDNLKEVVHTYNAPGIYNVELCIELDYCKTIQVEVSEEKKFAADSNSNDVKSKSTGTDNSQTISSSNFSTPKTTAISTSPSIYSNELTTEPIRKTPNNTNSNTYVTPITSDDSDEELVSKGEDIPEVKRPIFTVDFSIPSTVETGKSIQIKDMSSVQNGEIKTWSWNVNNQILSGKNISYTFQKPGDYQVRLCLNNGSNCKSKAIRVKEKYIPPPVPTYDIDFDMPTSVEEGQTIIIADKSTSNQTIKNYKWTIDGAFKSGKQINYTFTKPGSYSVKLCVDDAPCKTKSINVKAKKNVITNSTPTPPVEKKDPIKKVNKTETVATPPPTPTTSSNTSSSIVPDSDENFNPTKVSNKIGSFSDCEGATWVTNSQIKLNPTKKCILDRATLYASDNGKVQLKILYNYQGEKVEIPITKRVNKGRSDILLNNLYVTLTPGITYTLLVSVKGQDFKLKSIDTCTSAPVGDENLQVKHKMGYVLFDLKYKY